MRFTITIIALAVSIYHSRADDTKIENDSAPCAENDARCYNLMGHKYINAERGKYGDLNQLNLGTEAMFQAALEHSTYMAKVHAWTNKPTPFYPENNDTGCGTKMVVVNIALTHKTHLTDFNFKLDDYAGLCIKLLFNDTQNEGSMLKNYYSEYALGLAVDNQGYIWCTQFLAKDSNYTLSGSCSIAAELDSTPELDAPEDSPESIPDAIVSSDGQHTFKHHWAALLYKNQTRPVDAKLISRNSTWVYCTLNKDRCLTEKQSIDIDKQLSGQ